MEGPVGVGDVEAPVIPVASEMRKLLDVELRQQMLADFEASLDLAEEVRTRLLACGDHHNPWFVRMSLPLLKCDKLRQFLNTVKDMPDAAAFRMAAEHHDVSHGFIRNAISNMKIRLDSSHQPMENPIPMQVCLPLPDKDAFWPFGSLDKTYEMDFIWSPQDRAASGQLAPWQGELQREMREYLKERGMGPVQAHTNCFCPRSHFNFSRGFWLCVRTKVDGNFCGQNINWPHFEAPCAHKDRTTSMCVECVVSGQASAESSLA